MSTSVDPITSEVIRGAIVAITDEMKANLLRTAYNQIIYEAQDFTVGLFDGEGSTLSIGLGLPMFIRGLSDAIKAKLNFYGIEGIAPGDILLTNDSYIMGSHLNHLIFTAPIFHDGKLVAFASSMAHWIDVGGTMSGTTQDIYSEGLQIPFVKIFKAGVQDDEITRLIATNVRFPERAMGDLRAQVAAVKTGVERLTRLIGRYGVNVFQSAIQTQSHQSETLARKAVSDIPDGEYAAEAFMDDDGVNFGVPVAIRVKVVVSGDQMTIDLSGMSPQVAGYYNSGRTAGLSAAQVAFKCLTTPMDYPINDGALRALTVNLPSGTVISADKPAAMRWWMSYPMTVVDCIFRAVAQASVGVGIAGHHADLLFSHTHGIDQRSGRFFMLYCGPHGGGWGATSRHDGRSATVCINDGDTHSTPVEALEAKYPMVRVVEHRLRPDSGGAGKNRGGLGTSVSYRIDTSAKLNLYVERTRCAPWGLAGGADGSPNEVHVRHRGKELTFPTGKVDSLQLSPGDEWTMQSGGGGGYGPAAERGVECVLADVHCGYVSPAAAADHYKVIVRSSEPVWNASVDAEATRQVRASG